MSEKHWSDFEDKGSPWQMRLTMFFLKIIPVKILRMMAVPVGYSYYLFAPVQRTFVREYLRRVCPEKKLPVWKPFLAFAITVIEKAQSWAGKIPVSCFRFCEDSIDEFTKDFRNGRGAVLVCSHLGNMEMVRALASAGKLDRTRLPKIIAIVDFAVTSNFNEMMQKINGDFVLNLINADEIGPDTVIRLQEHIADGGLVVIAGDRSTKKSSDNVHAEFLGKKAEFPLGPFLLSVLLDRNPYFIFALREKDLGLDAFYDIHVHKSEIASANTRKQRHEQAGKIAMEFAALLEKYCKEYPFQWYNFYDFWEKCDEL